MITNKLCYYHSVCEQDEEHVPRFFADCERLGISFVTHFDRCSDDFVEWVSSHPLCIAHTRRNEPREFMERHKQLALDVLASKGFEWSCVMDIDETWEKDALPKIESILDGPKHIWIVGVRWLNLWEDEKHVRVDHPFGGIIRWKFRRVPKGRYKRLKFADRITANPSYMIKKGRRWVKTKVPPRQSRMDLVCLHWGLMTRELRLLHKLRWDRINKSAVGFNPQKFKKYILDETNLQVVEHSYL